MKKFNLDAALNGEPVKLACGRKAYILYDLSRYPELLKHANRKPLNGIVMSYDKENECYPNNWLLDGKNSCCQDNIIGMWKEPKKQINIEDLPKPFKPQETESYYYINGGCIGYRNEYRYSNLFDRYAAENGNCFRTREGAEMWLKLMKGMLE